MSTHDLKRNLSIRSRLVPLCVAMCVGPALFSGTTAMAAQDRLVGTWKASIQITDCVSGQEGGAPLTVLATYYADGNASEVPFTDPTERTSSHGRWTKTGKNTFASSTQFGVFDGNGFYVGYQVLDRMLEVAKGGQSYSVRAKTSRYGLSDELLFTVCATGTGAKLPKPEAF